MKAKISGPALLLMLLVALGGCASGGTGGGGGNPNLITQSQLEQMEQVSLYDAVRRLRPNWLSVRGPSTIMGEPTQVAVYVNGARVGSVEILRQIEVLGVTRVEYMSAADATTRYGTSHTGGAILVTTR